MDLISLLATVTEQAPAKTEPLLDVGKAKEYLWTQITGMDWFIALVVISVGIVYLLYGWRVFRVLVAISFGFIGMFLGILACEKLWPLIEAATLWGGVVGMILFALFAVPLMKWCVSILGAISGGIIGGGLWLALGFAENYMPAGFIAGFIAGGLISFIMLKISVMLFTSLGGSLITVTGLLALLYQYPPITLKVEQYYYNHWFLPVALVVPTVAGMLMQNKLIKDSPQWDISDK
jgi:hypothetical protein